LASLDARTEREAEPRRWSLFFGRPAGQVKAWFAVAAAMAPCGGGGGGGGGIGLFWLLALPAPESHTGKCKIQST
jgi:hypothetical protein